MTKVSKDIFIIKIENIADTNILMRAAANAVAKYVNCKSEEINGKRSHTGRKEFLKSRKHYENI